ncbi:uncharacterized protein J3R85_005343 [Psidium guajava]|nr:uncharacterized protein J3R85_005343 [Psidium guajava]
MRPVSLVYRLPIPHGSWFKSGNKKRNNEPVLSHAREALIA